MMRGGREQILGTLRDALRGLRLLDAASSHPGSFTGYPAVPAPGDPGLIARFGEELEAQGGVMHRVASDPDAAHVALAILKDHGADRVLSWTDRWLECPGLLEAIEQAGIEVVHLDLASDDPARRNQLDAVEPVTVGLTGSFAGLADTGSLVLASGSGRSRMASLLPSVHIAVLQRGRLFPTLSAFLAANPGALDLGSNVVLVTGPSRTADIEMTLTHGVHGPREVHVIVMA